MSLEDNAENRSHWIFALLLAIAGLLILLVFVNIKNKAEDLPSEVNTEYAVQAAAPSVAGVNVCLINADHATGGLCNEPITALTLLETDNTGDGGGKTAYITGTITDNNGFGDLLNQPTASFTYKFTSLAPSACTAGVYSDNDCIVQTVSGSLLDTSSTNCNLETVALDDTTATFSCLVDVPYNALPGDWTATVYVNDGTGTAVTAYSYASNVAIAPLTALTVPGTISYTKAGVNGLQIGDESDASSVTAYNTGNTAIDVKVHGTDMACTTGAITNGTSINFTSQVKAALTDLTFASMTSLGETLGAAGLLDANIPVASVSSTVQSDPIYTKLTVPTGVTGSCTGTMVFTAIASV
jgi:hypothetical protein